jgi:serine/threonine protein kinase
MSSNFSPGARLGRYEIKSQLGAGGMGEVYLAQDTILDRKVASKILPADLAANHHRMRPGMATMPRLLRNVRTLAR